MKVGERIIHRSGRLALVPAGSEGKADVMTN